MIARGKRERSEARRPWKQNKKPPSPERAKYYFGLSGLGPSFRVLNQGRRASLRSRLPLAIICRAVGAFWLSYVAPLALSGFHMSPLALSGFHMSPLVLSGFHMPRLWRLFQVVEDHMPRLWRLFQVVEIICRAFGAI